MQARFDKHGRRLADSGRGCGCGQCAEAEAPRYERRARSRRPGYDSTWHPLRRRLETLIRTTTSRLRAV